MQIPIIGKMLLDQKVKEYPLTDLIGETEITRLGDIKNNPEMISELT